MAEAETTRDVGRSHKIAAQQLVECRERGGFRDCRRCGYQLGLERVARDGRTLQYEARAIREQAELLGQCRDDGGWHLARFERDRLDRGCRARCSLL